MNQVVDLSDDIQMDGFEEVDAQHRLIDRHDRIELGRILGYVVLILVPFIILRNIDRSLFRYSVPSEWFKKEFGEINFVLLFRTVLVDFILLRLVAWSVSTISTCVLHRKLGNGKVLTRSNYRYQAGIYGFYPYDIIDPKWTWFDPSKYKFIDKYGFTRFFARWVSKRRALFEAYSKELRTELEKLNVSLKKDNYSEIDISRYDFKAFEGRKLRLNIQIYNHRLKELEYELEKENKTIKKYNESIKKLSSALETEIEDREEHSIEKIEIENLLKSSNDLLTAKELQHLNMAKDKNEAIKHIETQKMMRMNLDSKKQELTERKNKSDKGLEHIMNMISEKEIEFDDVAEKINSHKLRIESMKAENDAILESESTENSHLTTEENMKKIVIAELFVTKLELTKKSLEENISDLKSNHVIEKMASKRLTARLLAIESENDEAKGLEEAFSKQLIELKNEIEKLEADKAVLKEKINREKHRSKEIVEEIKEYNNRMTYWKRNIMNRIKNEVIHYGELEKELEKAKNSKEEADKTKKLILENRKKEAEKLIRNETFPDWRSLKIYLFGDKTIEEKEELENNPEENRNLINLQLLDIEYELEKLKAESVNIHSFTEQYKRLKDDLECIKNDVEDSENLTNDEAKLVYENQRSEKELDLPQFCREIRHSFNFRKRTSDSECTGNSKLRYLWTGNTSSHVSLGLKYNRVRRAAGILLLSEKEAERALGSRGKIVNGISALVIILLVLGIRSLVEGSMNISKIGEKTENLRFKGPVRGKGSWNCSYIDNSNLVLVREQVDNGHRNETGNGEKCLWQDRLEIVSVSRDETEFTIWYDPSIDQWRANETSNIQDDAIFNCIEQRVSKSMEEGGLAPGGFLQICGNENKGEIILIQEKIISTNLGYPKDTIIKKNVLKYSSDWITVNSNITSIVAEYIGIRKVMNIDYILLDLIRLHGVGEDSDYRSVTFDTIIEDGLVTSWEPFLISLVVVFMLFFFALIMKRIQLNSFGKINVRADDSSMLSTLYVSRTSLPTSNIVIPRLTPEFEMCATSRGTKYISSIEESDHKNTFRMLKYILSDESEKWTSLDRLRKESKRSEIRERIRSYKDISWEEIQGEESKWDDVYDNYVKEKLLIKEPLTDTTSE